MFTLLAPMLLSALASATPQAQQCNWSHAADTPQALVETQSAVIDGKLYLMGGFYSSGLKGTPRTDVYDPQSDSWTGLDDMLTVVTHHTAVVDGQKIWCAGGFFGDNGGFVVDTVQVYDVPTDRWSFGPALPERRAGGGMVRLGRNLHYFSGFETRRLNAAEHFVLDLDDPGAGWDQTSYAPLPQARGQLGAAVLNGFIYAIGGQFGHDLNPMDVDLVHRYDPSTNQWTQVASLPTPRSHFEASTFVYQGRIFVAGGRDNQSSGAQVLQQVSAYDPQSDSWSDVSMLPIGLIGPSAKPIGDQLYVSGGGITQNTPVIDHWVREVEPAVGQLLRLNAGGPMLSLGEDWCMDGFFVSGSPGTGLGTPVIAGTSDDPLYHSERTSSSPGADFAYCLPAEAGAYRINLHFAELEFTSPGQRVFDVLLEELLVLEDYDILQAVGFQTAEVRSFDVELGDAALDLSFESVLGNPKLSALEVLRLPDDSFGVFCSGAPNSVGSGARLGFLGSTSLAVGQCSLVASGLPPGKLARFVLGSAQGSTPFGDGSLCLAGSLRFSSVLSVDASGKLQVPLPLSIISPGVDFYFQVIYLDNAPFRYNASDGLQMRFTP